MKQTSHLTLGELLNFAKAKAFVLMLVRLKTYLVQAPVRRREGAVAPALVPITKDLDKAGCWLSPALEQMTASAVALKTTLFPHSVNTGCGFQGGPD